LRPLQAGGELVELRLPSVLLGLAEAGEPFADIGGLLTLVEGDLAQGGGRLEEHRCALSACGQFELDLAGATESFGSLLPDPQGGVADSDRMLVETSAGVASLEVDLALVQQGSVLGDLTYPGELVAAARVDLARVESPLTPVGGKVP